MKPSSLRRSAVAVIAFAAACVFPAQAGQSPFSSATQSRGSGAVIPNSLHKLLFPDSTYMIDDGTAEESIGVTAGGDLICLNEFPVVPGAELITSVSVAWGTPTFFDPTLDGLPYTAILWSDPNGDGNPDDAEVLATAPGVISQQGTDTFITTNMPPTVVTTPNFFVGVLVHHAAGQYPVAFDESDPTLPNRSYAAGDTIEADIQNLNNNELPVGTIESYDQVGNWMIRADGTGAGLFLASAASRQSHGSRGVFDIPLPLSGSVGIEDRDTTSDTIVFHFGSNLTSFENVSSSCGLVTNAMIDPDNTQNILVTLDASTCDQEVITLTLDGLEDDQGHSLASASVSYGKLIGDADGDGVVDFDDVAAVRRGQGHAVTARSFRFDLNLDGRINNADIEVARLHLRDALQ